MATKVIKEIITDVGGNTTIEYSDDTTQKYNVADVVTAQSNPLTGGIKYLTAAGTPIGLRAGVTAPLYFNRLLEERPQTSTPTGIASYTRGDMRFTVTAAAGVKTLTYVGGDPVSDAGTGAWMGVLQSNGMHTTVNVISRSGNTITLAQAATFSGDAVLSPYHDAINGQHLTPSGGNALAEMLFSAAAHALRQSPRICSVDSARGTWYASPWVGPNYNPGYWRPYGGIANNQVAYASVLNVTDTNKIMSGTTNRRAIANCTAVGHGMNMIVPVKSSGLVRVRIGSRSTPGMVRVAVLADGVEAYNKTSGPAVFEHAVPFGAADNLEIRVTSDSAAAMSVEASGVSVEIEGSTYRRAIEAGERVLVIGDSWTEEATRPEFVARLRVLADGIGAVVLPSLGVGGTQASYALTEVGGVRRIDSWLSAHAPDVCVIHYYINDYNAGVSAATWGANIAEICRTCIAAGVQPVVMLPGCTASESQTQSMILAYFDKAARPPEIKESVDSAVESELSGAAMFVNLVNKRPGRALRNITNGSTYVARGSGATDPWDCITASATPATITPA